KRIDVYRPGAWVTEVVTPRKASDKPSLSPSKSGHFILKWTRDLMNRRMCDGPSLRPSLRPVA
ncbi:hypothetical protein HAX54_011428, partial [Datura stramonium]|nr:hypothetical protein [Datura stramonium]